MKKMIVVAFIALLFLPAIGQAQEKVLKPACEETSIEGKIEAVSEDTVTVEGTTFRLKEGMTYKNGSKADLAVGVLIDIRGKKEDEVNWFAQKITFLEVEGVKRSFKGKIENVTDTGITVCSTFIYINDDTKFVKGTKEDLKAGLLVDVKAFYEAEAWISTMVKFVDGKDDPGDDKETVEVEGLITNLSPGLITVGDTVFKVNSKTKFFNTKLKKLEIGMLVKVIGYLEEEKNYALKVYSLDKKNGETRTIYDSIVSVEKDTANDAMIITLSKGEVITVPQGFPVHGRTGLETTVDDLIPLQLVRIKMQGDDAKNINVTGNIVKKGKITELISGGDLNGFVLNGKNFYYDDFTKVKDLEFATPPNEFEFMIDMKVLVIGNRLEDGSVLADRIIVGPETGQEKIFEFGVITSLVMEGEIVASISMNGYNFLLPGNLKINIAKFDGVLLHEELIAGLTAKIRGYKNAEGEYVIRKITIYLPCFVIDSVVQEAAEDFILIDDYKIYFRDETEFSETEWPTSQGEVLPGDNIKIRFLLWPDDTYVATEVEAGESD